MKKSSWLDNSLFESEYFGFRKPIKIKQKFLIGEKEFTSPQRITSNTTKLFNYYPREDSKRILSWKGNQFLPYTLQRSNLKNLQIEKAVSQFKIPKELNSILNIVKDSLIQNYAQKGVLYTPDSLGRLHSLQKNILQIQKVNYTETVATNLICDLKLNHSFFATNQRNYKSKSFTLRKFDMQRSKKKGTLPEWEDSCMANPMGVAGLGISKDRHLLFTHRSSHVSIFPLQLGPTASGYVNWTDCTSCISKSMDTLGKNVLLREIQEELGLESSEISKVHSLGLYKEFFRAGFPQIFYSFHISYTVQELIQKLRNSIDNLEGIGILSIPIQAFRDSQQVSQLLTKPKIHGIQMSTEALALLVCFLNQMD